MKKCLTKCLLFLALVTSATGCRSLFPSDASRTKTAWQTFDEAQAAFDKIVPHRTTHDDLRRLGFDPDATPNVRLLTYLDIIERFIPNQSITKEDLQTDVKRCIDAKDCCRAYELELNINQSKRYGNLAMDAFGFQKKTHVSGWNFKALVIVQDNLVVYKLRSGQPHVDRLERKTKPLGPFQDLEGIFSKLPGMM
jgi:hypothetical protein